MIANWRGQIRLPQNLARVQLTDAQKQLLEQQQSEQVQYFRDRAIRKIEEGSVYSSDYESVDQSAYHTTDDEEKAKAQIVKEE